MCFFAEIFELVPLSQALVILGMDRFMRALAEEYAQWRLLHIDQFQHDRPGCLWIPTDSRATTSTIGLSYMVVCRQNHVFFIRPSFAVSYFSSLAISWF